MPRLRRRGTRLVETVVREPSRGRAAARRGRGSAAPPRRAASARSPTSRPCRACRVGIGELDRVLGGGLVPGLASSSSAASRGSASRRSCSRPRPASPRPRPAAGGPVRDRRGVARPRSACAPPGSGCSTGRRRERDPGRSPRTTIDRIVERRAGRAGPALLVVDSIQTATVDELDGPPGSVGQVREATLRLMELAKGDGIAVILVGHVTKDGSIAGPKTLEHLVDAVLSLEGERYAALRLLRATKNRFGSTEEVGVFEMGETRPDARSPIRPARSSPTTTARRRAASSRRPSRAAGRCSSRSRRWSRRRGYGTPRADGQRPRPEPARAARRRPRPAGRDRPRQPRRLRQPRRRPDRRRARPRPAARARPRLVAPRPAGRDRAPSPSARSACSASCAPSAGSSGGCARPPGSGSAGRSCPRPARGPPRRRRRASRSSRSATPRATRSRPRCAGPARSGAWRGGPARC